MKQKIIASLLTLAMCTSWLPLSVTAEEVQADAETDALPEEIMNDSPSFHDISGTSTGNETLVDDAFMNVWAGIVFNGHYEYHSYMNDDAEECLEMRLVPDPGYVVEQFYAEDLPGERYESEDGVLCLKGNAEGVTQYWVEARTEAAFRTVSVSSPDDIQYTVFINRQKAGDKAHAGELVTVTAIPEEDAAYAGMKGYCASTGEELFETNGLFYTFTMPDDDVKVVLYAEEETQYTIDTSAITYGKTSIKVKGIETPSAACGKTVEVAVEPDEGFVVMGLHVIDAEGNSTFFGDKGEGSFVMPAGNVRLEADFIDKSCENGSFASAELHNDKELFYLILCSPDTHYLAKDVTAVYTDGKEQVYETQGTGMTKVYPSDRGSLMTIHFQEDPNFTTYVDENGTEYRAYYATDLSKTKEDWLEGWYYISSDTTLHERVEIIDTVNLILADGCTLRVERGIHNAGFNRLIIWGQKEGTGKLFCERPHEDYQASIGGNDGENGGVFYVHSGNVEVESVREDGAGIGGGRYGSGGNIFIYGGSVRVNAGKNGVGGGAGIGGGLKGDGGNINIYGGIVEATGSGGQFAAGAGIGGGDYGCGGMIEIAGGTVTAKGGAGSYTGGAAGIGGGNHGHGTSITISGGKTKSTGSGTSAGIGGGYFGSGGNITILGGDTVAVSPYSMFYDAQGAGFGSGNQANGGDQLGVCRIKVLGGRAEGHGFQAFGRGTNGRREGTLELGDNIWAGECDNIFPYNERYEKARISEVYLIELKDRPKRQ